MKQKDIALVIIIVFVSGLFSFFITNIFIAPSKEKQEAEVVEAITADFPDPDDKYFNAQSINPTQTIKIGDNPNPQPFN